jgi:hypothetical protein
MYKRPVYFNAVGFQARSQNCGKRLLASTCLFFRPSAWNSSAYTGRIFRKFYIWVFFEDVFRKFKFHENLTRITGTLHEDQYTFLIIRRSVLLRTRNVSDKICRKNCNTHFVLKFFFFENHAVYEIMWENRVESDRPQITKLRMRIGCWVPKAKNLHS